MREIWLASLIRIRFLAWSLGVACVVVWPAFLFSSSEEGSIDRITRASSRPVLAAQHLKQYLETRLEPGACPVSAELDARDYPLRHEEIEGRASRGTHWKRHRHRGNGAFHLFDDRHMRKFKRGHLKKELSGPLEQDGLFEPSFLAPPCGHRSTMPRPEAQPSQRPDDERPKDRFEHEAGSSLEGAPEEQGRDQEKAALPDDEDP